MSFSLCPFRGMKCFKHKEDKRTNNTQTSFLCKEQHAINPALVLNKKKVVEKCTISLLLSCHLIISDLNGGEKN